MKIKIDNAMQKKIIVYSTSLLIAITIGLIIFNFNSILDYIKKFLAASSPFILGFALAFVLRKPVNWLHKRVFKTKRGRLYSTLLIFAVFLILIVVLSLLIFPSIFSSIQSFITNYQDYMNRIQEFVNYLNWRFSISIEIPKQYLNGKWLTEYISSNSSVLATYSITFIRSIFNFLIAYVAAIYMLLDKQSLKRGFKKLNYSIFDLQIADMITQFIRNARDIFDRYIVGSLLDSTIVAIICFVGCTLMGLPYVPMITFIIALTNLIPVFGPFLGAIPVIILLLLINPWYALGFGIFILATQQLDGNLIKPIVLGDQLGLSGFWILFSVTVGGNLGGILGMFLGVPIFALVYKTLEDFSNMRLQNKNIDLSEDGSL